jgi:hypothetical protein
MAMISIFFMLMCFIMDNDGFEEFTLCSLMGINGFGAERREVF